MAPFRGLIPKPPALRVDSLLNDTSYFSVWIGTTVGFLTKVFVTGCLLVIFVPLLRQRIADRIVAFASHAIDGSPTAVKSLVKGGAIGLIMGLFFPPTLIGWALSTVTSSLSAMDRAKKAAVQRELNGMKD